MTPGRKSELAQELTTIKESTHHERPKAPDCLTEEQVVYWDEIVNRLPAHWFPIETHPLLIQYVRLITESNIVAKQLETVMNDPEFDFKKYKELSAAQRNVTQVINTLARSMRLSQGSTIIAKAAGAQKAPTVSEEKPWT